jgi:hypothetical protein
VRRVISFVWIYGWSLGYDFWNEEGKRLIVHINNTDIRRVFINLAFHVVKLVTTAEFGWYTIYTMKNDAQYMLRVNSEQRVFEQISRNTFLMLKLSGV